MHEGFLKMVRQGDVVTYREMCAREGVTLRRGMNFRMKGRASVIPMSLRPDQPYEDRRESHALVYEGHDIVRRAGPDPKTVDQPAVTPSGRPTQNGLFFEAAAKFKRGESEPELVRVYEKIRRGLWAFNGLFNLVDAWQEISNGRKVFKFKLELLNQG